MAKGSIRSVVLGSWLAGLTAMIPVARAADGEAAPVVVDGSPPPGPPAVQVTVGPAPGVDLPPQVAADVRAAIEDALAGRAQPGVPIDVTLEAASAVVRVGSLWRRITIARWDYSAMRTVALHVVDLSQPAPDVPQVVPADQVGGPAVGLVAQGRTGDRAAERSAEPGAPWSVHGTIAGSRGAQSPDPWMVSVAAGAAWTHDWMQFGVEVGWDHAIVRHVDGAGLLTTVKYDATPVRLVFAAQNAVVRAGIRGGIAEYRVTGMQEDYWITTPVVGPFLAARFPIAGRVHGLLVGGFDYFARRTELSVSGFDTAYSTPAVAPYVGVVVETVLGP